MKATLIIPDISGFTGFVEKNNNEVGMHITSELLNTIIESNPLQLEISEIEGDAVLFYHFGSTLTSTEVFDACTCMFNAFTTKLKTLEENFNIHCNLSLKFIVHYGEVNRFAIHGFTKLFGQAVIDAHMLLKNGGGYQTYVLFTADYIAAAQDFKTAKQPIWKLATSSVLSLHNHRSIKFYYYTYRQAG